MMRRGAVILSSALLVASAATVGAQTPPTDHVVVTPDQLHWTPYYAGGEQAILLGDPSRPGPYVLRVRFPAGLHIQPHYHLDNRIVQVLSGTMYFALGASGDTSKMRAIPVGSMWTEPARMIHYAWTGTGEVVLQVVGTGPTETKSVAPTK
ncbi:MAG TPA: cupin domain-containing protein, partial [Gemmatimonadales bacterium]|nr:cupin domain-containing protein [Gemmatimonadales bacterium]